MPSSSADGDKAYVKKHKINDLLNELYLELTKQKPENPLEFAIQHLESKLPEPLRRASKAEPMSPSGKESSPARSTADDAQQAQNLMSKIFGSKNLLGKLQGDGMMQNVSQTEGEPSQAEVGSGLRSDILATINPFIKINIMV